MKAIIYENYGPPEVLALREIEKPVPKDDEILIKVHATTVTSGDWRVRSLEIPRGFRFLSRLVFGFNKPKQKILGTELAGEIEAIGKKVSQFKIGDAVFAFGDLSMGCYVEYKCMPEKAAIALKPENLTYPEAAALSFGGTTALQFFKRGKIAAGEKVLINGASGGVGTAAIQLARYWGAEVTAVCSKTNADLVKSLGADHVIDYTQDDFSKNGQAYDIIMDVAGTAPFSRSKNSLKKGGRLLLVLATLPEMLKIPWHSLTSNKKIIAGPATSSAKDLDFLAELARNNKFKPVIDKSYRFDQMVEAHRYVDQGHKKGNVIITLEH